MTVTITNEELRAILPKRPKSASRQVEINGVLYESQIAAADALGKSASQIHRLVHGKTQAGPERRGESRRRQVTIDGVSYESLSAAARALGKTSFQIHYMLNKKPKEKGRGEALRRPVMVNGVLYESQTAAVEAAGISAARLCALAKAARAAGETNIVWQPKIAKK